MAIPRSQEKEFTERFHEYARTLDCVHCGLCIPDCPTYGVTGREADSPRGRIYLMRGYAERALPLSREALRHLDQCIVCRACETVCPSGIRMGEMMESFRHEIQQALPRRGWRYYVSRFVLRELIPFRHRLAALTDILFLYERVGLRRLFRWLAKRGPRRLAELDALLPPIPAPSRRRLRTDASLPGGIYRARGKARMRAALFLGCIASEWFVETHRATIRVLNRAGCDVVVPDAQTCCGALHRHGGFLEDAAALYRRNAAAFSPLGCDVVVVNAAGCGAALKEPPPPSSGLGVPVRDICELLDGIGIAPPDGEFPHRVAYDQPCHLVHGQRLGPDVVTRLLRQVPGLVLVPLEGSERCCGAGGIYNLVQPQMARAILAEKVAAIVESGAEVVLTGNPGCWLQISAGLDGRGIEVLHPVEVLDRAYRA
jgi:glycolate oxidase iron-sulfur subunit